MTRRVRGSSLVVLASLLVVVLARPGLAGDLAFDFDSTHFAAPTMPRVLDEPRE